MGDTLEAGLTGIGMEPHAVEHWLAQGQYSDFTVPQSQQGIMSGLKGYAILPPAKVM